MAKRRQVSIAEEAARLKRLRSAVLEYMGNLQKAKREKAQQTERHIAIKFLRRALRVKGDYWARHAESLGDMQRWALWRVVVAASHKSGKFER